MATLVLYDAENIKVPVFSGKKRYRQGRVNMKSLFEKIKNRFQDCDFNFISFQKKYRDTDKIRAAKTQSFNDKLSYLNIGIVEKEISTGVSSTVIDGEEKSYTYEECDMDGEIIHEILTNGIHYSRIILISGDSDMKKSLTYMMNRYGTEVCIIAHRENMSKKYGEEFTTIYLDELLDQ